MGKELFAELEPEPRKQKLDNFVSVIVGFRVIYLQHIADIVVNIQVTVRKHNHYTIAPNSWLMSLFNQRR